LKLLLVSLCVTNKRRMVISDEAVLKELPAAVAEVVIVQPDIVATISDVGHSAMTMHDRSEADMAGSSKQLLLRYPMIGQPPITH
jgi:hypothetical protein